MAKCMICGKAPPSDPVSLHRINAKGQTGVWGCDAHARQAAETFAKAKGLDALDDRPKAALIQSGWKG